MKVGIFIALMRVVVIVCMLVFVSVAMMMVAMVIAKQESTEQIYTQSKDRDRNGLIKSNHHGIKQAVYTFVADKQRNHCQCYRARKCANAMNLKDRLGDRQPNATPSKAVADRERRRGFFGRV